MDAREGSLGEKKVHHGSEVTIVVVTFVSDLRAANAGFASTARREKMG